MAYRMKKGVGGELDFPVLPAWVSCSPQGHAGEESSLYREPIQDSRWQEVISLLNDRVSLLDPGQVGPLAAHITHRIHWLDEHMHRYCRASCPSCEDPCCDGREVFFNQADLIFLAASGGPSPPGQTRRRAEEKCRYLTPSGCSLSRRMRPYVCVWFLCDAHMKQFSLETASFQRKLIRALQEVRALRLGLEALYQQRFALT